MHRGTARKPRVEEKRPERLIGSRSASLWRGKDQLLTPLLGLSGRTEHTAPGLSAASRYTQLKCWAHSAEEHNRCSTRGAVPTHLDPAIGDGAHP